MRYDLRTNISKIYEISHQVKMSQRQQQHAKAAQQAQHDYRQLLSFFCLPPY